MYAHILAPCIFNLSVGKLLIGNMEEEGAIVKCDGLDNHLRLV